MTLLGIDVPRWLGTRSPAETPSPPRTGSGCSAGALLSSCRRLGWPFGLSVESLSNRTVESDGSTDLAREIRLMLC